MFPKKLYQKLDKRHADNALRKLGMHNTLIDFSSNDYLGFAKSKTLFDQAHLLLKNKQIFKNGATGSRLLSGNHNLYKEVESQLCKFHNSEAALVFNSGYDANMGFFSCVPQRNDIIIYDELIHASIRDGISMNLAKSYKFKHNNLDDLHEILKRVKNYKSDIYVVTESVFSMDGDSPDLKTISQICKKQQANLIVDEAHAIGVFGQQGCGKIQQLNLEEEVFARIITFGKALGCHGAAILGNENLKNYLINFSRPFIYTTGLPPHSLATIYSAYKELSLTENIEVLHQNIKYFKSELQRLELTSKFIDSSSAIHCCLFPGNKNIKHVAFQLQQNGFDVKAILSPTITKGKERLRFCLHNYNSSEEITKVLELVATFVTK